MTAAVFALCVIMLLYTSSSDDPAVNCGMEEQLYLTGVPCLFFYSNAPSVIIGRNQNPFREVALEWCRQHQVPVIRRISGGGAVYHDEGNLNYVFVVPRSEYHPDTYVGMVVEALHALGLSSACISGQHSIFADGRKVSGSAFALNSQHALLHGCILVNTDLLQLSAALKQPPYEFRGGGVASVRSPVTNLNSFIPSLTPVLVRNAILHRVQMTLKVDFESAELPPPNPEVVEKYTTHQWNMGRTPTFSVRLHDEWVTVANGNWPLPFLPA